MTFVPGEHDLPEQTFRNWIKKGHQALVAYYGQFPVSHLKLRVTFEPGGHGVSHGKTWGENGALIHITVGQHATQAHLDDDWMLVHEMVHLGLPSLPDAQHWLEEGSATYIEPIARVLSGNLTPERIWSDMVRDMPQGNPQPDEHGLDHTQSWASTYWGGALFCLLADIEIRKGTHGAKGLQQAMQSVLKAGGNILVDWPINKLLATADAAVGLDALQSLYERMGKHNLPVDLVQLWKELGITTEQGRAAFDDRAPLAYVRKAITASK